MTVGAVHWVVEVSNGVEDNWQLWDYAEGLADAKRKVAMWSGPTPWPRSHWPHWRIVRLEVIEEGGE